MSHFKYVSLFLKAILAEIVWPVEDSDDEDDSYPLTIQNQTVGFLRKFIETGNVQILLINVFNYIFCGRATFQFFFCQSHMVIALVLTEN